MMEASPHSPFIIIFSQISAPNFNSFFSSVDRKLGERMAEKMEIWRLI